jgi:predicted transcriptional regulator
MKTIITTIRIPAALLQRLTRAAKRLERSKNYLILKAIEAYLDREGQ